MKQCRYGNPKKKSRFICLKCLEENLVGQGIQRSNQRKINHIKDLYCIYCKNVTKNLEVRHCDVFTDKMEYAIILQKEYY